MSRVRRDVRMALAEETGALLIADTFNHRCWTAKMDSAGPRLMLHPQEIKDVSKTSAKPGDSAPNASRV